MKEMWNERFSGDIYVYGEAPNAFFKAFIDRTKAGSVLLAAEGEGRNALYALEKGWEVHAVDFSESGREKAIKLAAKKGYSLNYEIADLARWESDIKVDAIGLIFAHFPSEIRHGIHRKLVSLLNPGGKIILQAFSKDQLNFSSGGPKNVDWLYNTPLLQEDFSELQVELIEEKIEHIEEGKFHSGEAAIIQLIARNI